ncbi:hypothetical protein GCM10009801_62840 [Streptomyces albiaxialis]|uniref:YcaO domain-containing protein n=1 Tax=Streptomyces albiaxialis TaxID=329523 RepID=A0ABN2WL34_9ACTN
MAREPDRPLLDVRPRLRADALFAATEEGVLLQHPDGQFVLRGRTAYQWMCRLAPHLTGDHTVRDLCAGLPEPRQATLTAMLRTLLERGVVRDAGPPGDEETLLDTPVRTRFARQLAYVEHFASGAGDTPGPYRRFRRFRDTRVLVVGGGEAALTAALGLLRNGLRAVMLAAPWWTDVPPALAEETAELSAAGCDAEVGVSSSWDDGCDDGTYEVVLACGADARTMERLNSLALNGGPALLPLTPVHGAAVLGPLVRPGRPGCRRCALLRLAANLDAEGGAALFRSTLLAGAGAPGGAGGTRGSLPPGLERMLGTALAFDVFRWRTGALAAETEGAVLVQDTHTWATAHEPLLPHPSCGACATVDGADEVPQRSAGASALFGRRVGVFAGYADDALTQSPLRVGRVETGPPGSRSPARRALTAFDLDTAEAARERARAAAALVYVARVHEDGLPPFAARHAGTADVAPEELATWSGLPSADGAGTSAEPLSAVLEATAPGSGLVRTVPAGAVHPDGALGRERRFESGGAGAGAGVSEDEAVEAGLLSALAHRGLVAALRGESPAAPLPSPPRTGEGPLPFLRRAADGLGHEVTLLDLPGAAPGHAVAALATGAGGADAAWALGHGRDRGTATAHALRDLVGALQLGDDTPDTGDPLVHGLGAEALRAASEGGPAPERQGTGSVEELADLLASSGWEALVVPTTPPDLRACGMTTVRVLLRRVPGADAR